MSNPEEPADDDVLEAFAEKHDGMSPSLLFYHLIEQKRREKRAAAPTHLEAYKKRSQLRAQVERLEAEADRLRTGDGGAP